MCGLQIVHYATLEFVLPCRSVLRQGPYTLHMWSYLDLEEGAITYQADKLSSATNPDVAESMAITIFLDRYSFPVVLPNSFSPSEYSNSPTFALSKSESSASSYEPSSSPPSTLTKTDSSSVYLKPHQGQSAEFVTLRSPSTVTKTNKGTLKRFRQESIRYASNLPHFLRSVDWMDRRVVEDVHWLLGNWDAQELDVAVALELLSMDFADETVRRLAVQRLENLSNDDVLRYLLQLVQVCVCINQQIYIIQCIAKTSHPKTVVTNSGPRGSHSCLFSSLPFPTFC